MKNNTVIAYIILIIIWIIVAIFSYMYCPPLLGTQIILTLVFAFTWAVVEITK